MNRIYDPGERARIAAVDLSNERMRRDALISGALLTRHERARRNLR